MIEAYTNQQGAKIYVSFSDSLLSVGSLVLNSHCALPKHNRPVTEQLRQIEGECVMKLFDGDTLIQEIRMKEGDSLLIPANQFHIHSNPTTDTSITLWEFEGDITGVIENIRTTFQKIS